MSHGVLPLTWVQLIRLQHTHTRTHTHIQSFPHSLTKPNHLFPKMLLEVYQTKTFSYLETSGRVEMVQVPLQSLDLAWMSISWSPPTFLQQRWGSVRCLVPEGLLLAPQPPHAVRVMHATPRLGLELEVGFTKSTQPRGVPKLECSPRECGGWASL